MIRSAAIFADTASGHTLDNAFVRYVDVDDVLDINAHSVQSFSLRNRSGEAVENEAILCVRLCDPVLQYTDNDIIGVMTGFVRGGKEHSVREPGYRLYVWVWLHTAGLRMLLKRCRAKIKRRTKPRADRKC